MTKCWQSMHSRDTKKKNIDKDLENIQSTAKRVGWSEEEKAARVWKQLEGDLHDQVWVSESTRRSDGQGFGSRGLYSVRGTMEHAVGFPHPHG